MESLTERIMDYNCFEYVRIIVTYREMMEDGIGVRKINLSVVTVEDTFVNS